MRQDTQTAISFLPTKEQSKALKRASDFEELESRLSSDRTVWAAFQTVCRPKDGEGHQMDLGALMISTYGFHWLGERSGRIDVSWDQAVRSDVIVIPLSMIRKSKRAFRLEVESQEFNLQFHLADEEMASWIKGMLGEAQPML